MLLKKTARFILVLIGVLLILFLVLQVLMNTYFNKRIGERIHEEFDKSGNSTYSLDFDTPSLSLFNRSIQIKNITFLPLKVDEDSTKVMYNILVKELTVSGIGLSDLRKKNFNAANLLIDGLSVMIYQGARVKGEKVVNKGDQSESPKINSVKFGSIQVDDVQLKIFHDRKDTIPTFLAARNSINIKNFVVDSITRSLDKPFSADVFDISMSDLQYRFPNGLYTLTGKHLNTSYFDSILKIDSIDLLPNFSKEKFGEIVGYQVSRTKVGFSQLNFLALDIRQFLENNAFIARRLQIEGLSINVFRDNNIKFKNIVRPSMQQIIRKMPFTLSIDSTIIPNGRIVYEEFSEGASSPEKISFEIFNAVITGLNNDTSNYNEKSKMDVRCSASFMNKSRFELSCSFPLNTTQETFYCSGVLTELPFSTMDKLLEKKAHATVAGQLDSLKFNFYANNARSKGKLRFIYHDLKITLLDKEENVSKLKNKITSLILEKVFIEESNPGKDGIVRMSDISFERDPYRFFVYYIWKSIQSGIAPAVGIPVLKKKDIK